MSIYRFCIYCHITENLCKFALRNDTQSLKRPVTSVKTIHYQQAEFLLSAHTIQQLPPDIDREVAFAGRSNAGKSSVINTLTRRRKLAKTSSTPGKTRLINIFTLDQGLRLVDLPGYGYAKVSAAVQKHWQGLISSYLEQRRSLQGLVLIVDIRRGLSDRDLQLLEWCQFYQLPVHVLLNKMDKISGNAARQELSRTAGQLGDSGVTLQLFSALKRTGVEELEDRLTEWLS